MALLKLSNIQLNTEISYLHFTEHFQFISLYYEDWQTGIQLIGENNITTSG